MAAGTWVDELFAYFDGRQARDGHVTVAELVYGCMPDHANLYDCTGAGACVRDTTRDRAWALGVGKQAARRYLMQILALDATFPNQPAILADGKVSLAELRRYADHPMFELMEYTDAARTTLAPRPEYRGYYDEAEALLGSVA